MPRKTNDYLSQTELRHIGQKIKEIREHQGKRQQDINAALGRGEGYMSKLESGKAGNFSIDVAIGLSELLGVSTGEILDRKEHGQAAERCFVEGTAVPETSLTYKTAALFNKLPKTQQETVFAMIAGLLPSEETALSNAAGKKNVA